MWGSPSLMLFVRGRFSKYKLDVLPKVNQCRSLVVAKAKCRGSNLADFKRTLTDLADIGIITPVTIPRERGISHISNLLHAFIGKNFARTAYPDLPLV